MKFLNYFATILILLFCNLCCYPSPSGADTAQSSTTTIIIDTKKGVEVSDFFGYNSTIMPYHLTNDYDSLYPILKQLSPRILRFPGGTIANFYHPEGPGYGMDLETINRMKNNNMSSLIVNQNKRVEDEKIKDNYKKPFAKLCKQLNVPVLLVANLFDGTIEETLSMIKYFKSQGIKISGIELGNEYYLNAYKNVFPSASSYIKTSKKFAMAIRKKYPNIKIAAVGAPNQFTKEVSLKRTLYYDKWNKELSVEKYYDAITSHIYVKSKECDDIENTAELFNCASDVFNNYSDKTFEKVITEYEKIYGAAIKVWLTEWNLRETKKYFGNTFIQAIHAMDFALNTIKINTKHKDAIEYSIYHNLCAGGAAFALINPTSGKEKSDGQKFIRRTAYYPLKMLQQTLNVVDIEYVPIKKIEITKEQDIAVFFSKTKSQLYIYVTNKTDKSLSIIDFKLDQLSLKNATITQLKASGLTSGIGKVNYQKAAISGEINSLNSIIDLSKWFAPAYSINKITVDI